MNSRARVATVCQNGARFADVAQNREYVLSLLDSALSVEPDLVCLPETFTTVGIDDRSGNAEPVPGPTTEACARRAREANAYVVCPIRTIRDGVEWNSAVIIDRSGDVMGIYDKAHPVTTSEDYTSMEYGIRPGPQTPPVFDLDFGRIGIQICYDAGFPETWQDLAEQGARLVLWPSAYNGGFPLRLYAYLHHYHVVSSVQRDKSRIVDPLGVVRAETDERLHIVHRDINLDFVVSHWDFNYTVPDQIRTAYGPRVAITSDRDSAHFLVEPIDPAVRVDEMKREIGFESTMEYHNRHRASYQLLRAGKDAPPQRAAHAGRNQYSR